MNKGYAAADRILEGSRSIWETFHDHPFVRGIADGTLPKENFKYYMLQDYVYLLDYAKVFSIGAGKAADPVVGRHFSGYVDQIMNGELNIHKAYMAKLGITEQDVREVYQALDNLSYTSYMLRCAYEGGPAEVCAAILPCAISYEEIAVEMVRRDPACVDHPFYGEWIRGYADPGYHEANTALRDLTAACCENLSEQQIDHLVEIGQRCSLYEGRFWDLAWELRR
ncbi:MAG: thiaminase II [Lachnospiraceae bacterium]|nr:thiaminase II [Lachnospiraceae bacterium]